jgi:flavin-dependent dehydrogenase
MFHSCEVLIVGGSVAGATLAIHLGRRGLRTIICDKARFPRRKACGEGLLPHGARELKSLGFGDPPGMRVSGIRYIGPSGGSATGTFADAGLGPGYVVHRDVFDHWLLNHARATPGVEIRRLEIDRFSMDSDGVEAGGIRARIIVGADGLRSVFHRQGPFRRTHPRRRRVGMSMVIRGYPARETVDVYLGRTGEAYVGPSGPGEASLAVLLEHGISLKEFLKEIPALRDVEIARPPIGASPLGSRVTPTVHARIVLIGDAAGAVDPVSGEGMSLALVTARVAAEAIRGAIESGDLRALSAYASDRRRRMEPAARLGGVLLRLSRHPWLADRAVRGLSRTPEIFARLLRAACGAGPLGLLEPARLVL